MKIWWKKSSQLFDCPKEKLDGTNEVLFLTSSKMEKDKDAFGRDITEKTITQKRNKTIAAIDLIDIEIEGIPKITQIVAVAAHFQKKINEAKKEEE